MMLDSPLDGIKGVGPELSKKLAILGLNTVYDLLFNFPRKYEDYSNLATINSLHPGQVSIKATITQVSGRYVRRSMHITEAVASDETGSVKLVWFNQPYRAQSIKHGAPYFISGEYALKRGKFSITSPAMELASDLPINAARIIPIYRETKGIKSSQIRKLLSGLRGEIEKLDETLPQWIIDKHGLITHAEAVRCMHFPETMDDIERARLRLGYEEVFGLTLAALQLKYELQTQDAVAIAFDEQLASTFVKHLPFTLTDDQRKVAWQIYLDMQKTVPMNRLVEGDVGSGKTVVAAMAAIMVLASGYQVALMAPTELLARQHYETITGLLKSVGYQQKVGLLIGGMSATEKTAMHKKIAAHEVGFIIGTHALIQEKVVMSDLGLVIIDEQHRFGVEQRKKLQAKAGHALHILNMTATPIPRTLALTLYGELDISVIAHKPAGRLPTKTEIVSPNSKKQMYDAIRNELVAGRQLFVVCPLVADSAMLDARSAESVYEEYQKVIFKDYTVGLLHGKMKPAEKDEIMQAFASGALDILVATTVIEVGVNVPNASVMVVENAERFGLAQIHQLRGRVGRSEYQGYCYLVMGDSAAPSKRIRALERSSDGFKLAELDLEIRGPGAIYGHMQHGELDLRIAKLTDTKLIAAARADAQQFIDQAVDIRAYPDLHKRVRAYRAVTKLN